MHTLIETDKNVRSLDEASLAYGPTENAAVAHTTYQLIEQTLQDLPARLHTLKLSGQLDIAEVVILEQALLLLQVELSLLPSYQQVNPSMHLGPMAD